MFEIETEDISHTNWLRKSRELLDKSNLLCVTKEEYKTQDYNPLIWFGTNLAQYLVKDGVSEICPLFGGQIKCINNFAYQLCRAIPWGFEMGYSIHAVYDVILNFTTQPQNRYFIWYDAQFLFRNDRRTFDEIYEAMIVASYLNSQGNGTHDYKVNQKVLLLFDNTSIQEVEALLDRTYYTPSVYDTSTNEKEQYVRHLQTLAMIK